MVESVIKTSALSTVSDVTVQLVSQARSVTQLFPSYVIFIHTHQHPSNRLFLSAVGCSPGCLNGGSCNVNICQCLAGYTGSLCETRSMSPSLLDTMSADRERVIPC